MWSAIQILQAVAAFLPALASVWKGEKRNLVTRNHVQVKILSLDTLGSSHGSHTLAHSELWKGKLRALPLCFFSFFTIMWVLASSPNSPHLQCERESFARLVPGSKEPSKTEKTSTSLCLIWISWCSTICGQVSRAFPSRVCKWSSGQSKANKQPAVQEPFGLLPYLCLPLN